MWLTQSQNPLFVTLQAKNLSHADSSPLFGLFFYLFLISSSHRVFPMPGETGNRTYYQHAGLNRKLDPPRSRNEVGGRRAVAKTEETLKSLAISDNQAQNDRLPTFNKAQVGPDGNQPPYHRSQPSGRCP